MNNRSINTKARLSSAKSVGFRAGPELRSELEHSARLLSRPGAAVTISDILREGVTAFWPQIRIYLRAQARVGGITPRSLTAIRAASTRAHQNGLSLAEIKSALQQALTVKHGAEAGRHNRK